MEEISAIYRLRYSIKLGAFFVIPIVDYFDDMGNLTSSEPDEVTIKTIH